MQQEELFPADSATREPAAGTAPTAAAGGQLILVDEDDRPTDFAHTDDCHRGEGRLHRAFSLLLFDDSGRLLLQQRASTKLLWPGFWSNSCCSHPGPGETPEIAARRRAREELGVDVQPRFLYRFRYHARYLNVGAEHELCSVLVASTASRIAADPAEVADWRYLTPAEVSEELARHPERYTPWFHLEWGHIRSHFPDLLRPPLAAIA